MFFRRMQEEQQLERAHRMEATIHESTAKDNDKHGDNGCIIGWVVINFVANYSLLLNTTCLSCHSITDMPLSASIILFFFEGETTWSQQQEQHFVSFDEKGISACLWLIVQLNCWVEREPLPLAFTSSVLRQFFPTLLPCCPSSGTKIQFWFACKKDKRLTVIASHLRWDFNAFECLHTHTVHYQWVIGCYWGCLTLRNSIGINEWMSEWRKADAALFSFSSKSETISSPSLLHTISHCHPNVLPPSWDIPDQKSTFELQVESWERTVL